ncbi:MAG: LytTR family DNA-binding domain-containing protein [Spirosomataceae bacterium]
MAVANFNIPSSLSRFLSMDQIAYLQSDRNYTFIYCPDGTRHLSCKTLLLLEADLPIEGFIRINRGVIINVVLISHYNRKNRLLNLSNGLSFVVARRCKMQV